jgi:hypothetical protein
LNSAPACFRTPVAVFPSSATASSHSAPAEADAELQGLRRDLDAGEREVLRVLERDRDRARVLRELDGEVELHLPGELDGARSTSSSCRRSAIQARKGREEEEEDRGYRTEHRDRPFERS